MYQCCKCKQFKNSFEFAKDKTSKLGHSTTCKQCKSEYKKEYRKRPYSIIKQREYSAKYKFNHPEITEYQIKNSNLIKKTAKELQRVSSIKFKLTIKDIGYKICLSCGEVKTLTSFESVYWKGSFSRRSYCKVCRLPELKIKIKRYKQTEKYKTYYKKYREKVRLSGHQARYSKIKRAIKKEKELAIGVDNKRFSIKDLQYVYNQFENKCFNCDSIEDLQIDHHYPISKGNPLTIDNAVLLCGECNIKKRDRNPKEFYSPIQLLLLKVYYNKIDNGKIKVVYTNRCMECHKLFIPRKIRSQKLCSDTCRRAYTLKRNGYYNDDKAI